MASPPSSSFDQRLDCLEESLGNIMPEMQELVDAMNSKVNWLIAHSLTSSPMVQSLLKTQPTNDTYTVANSQIPPHSVITKAPKISDLPSPPPPRFLQKFISSLPTTYTPKPQALPQAPLDTTVAPPFSTKPEQILQECKCLKHWGPIANDEIFVLEFVGTPPIGSKVQRIRLEVHHPLGE
jgi:hypothetical protein